MTRLFLNGLGASAGGGLTYLRNVLPHLSQRTDFVTIVALNPGLRSEFDGLPNIEFVPVPEPMGTLRRFLFEQARLPSIIRKSRAQALISAGNIALRNSPVPQILLSRNSLYTSPDFYRDLLSRHEHGMWLDTRVKGVLAKKSVHWSDCTVAPSRAFADDLQRWTGRNILAIQHGFDPRAFFCDRSPLPNDVQRSLRSTEGNLRLLFVSHYNYYRNFEVLIRAIPLLREKLQGRGVRLFLTCNLRNGQNPGSYRTEKAASLIEQMGIREEVVELGPVPYHLLHQVYSACDIYVTPAYTETFAHPLVEAMASGLPVVASDLRVHREVCGESALYFDRFSPMELAERICEIANTRETAARLSTLGRKRSANFSWSKHVSQMLDVVQGLLSSDPARA
jgi:glycosyltransferase involved in cell wall biosynthesis